MRSAEQNVFDLSAYQDSPAVLQGEVALRTGGLWEFKNKQNSLETDLDLER